MNRSLLSISLLLILISPILIGFTGIQWHKWALRKAIKQQIIYGIDQSELTLLSFSKHDAESQLEWEHEREFEYLGNMYDVVTSHNIGDSIYFWCWVDNAETALNKKLNCLLSGELNQNKEHQQGKDLVVKHFRAEYRFEKQSFSFIHKLGDKPTNGSYKNDIIADLPIKVICPPPQI